MRRAEIYRKGIRAGTLSELEGGGYDFRYDTEYFRNDRLPAISLTMPKSQQVFQSNHLFPCFFNMLSEGANRHLQARQLKIDEKDFFGLLLATATHDTVGAITVKEIE
jgi:serine/threonine-protein kinase HipA